jgi:hypothetical protein
MTVSGRTITSADRQSRQHSDSVAHSNRSEPLQNGQLMTEGENLHVQSCAAADGIPQHLENDT